MKNYLKITIALVINILLTYIFLQIGFWYGLIISGFISAILFSQKAINISIIAFLSSILGTFLFMIPLFMNNLTKLMYYVGVIAGISGTLLLGLIFLLSGIMGISGALIGNYFRYYIDESRGQNFAKT